MWDAKGRTGSANYVREKGRKEEKTEIKRKEAGNPGFPVRKWWELARPSVPVTGLTEDTSRNECQRGGGEVPPEPRNTGRTSQSWDKKAQISWLE